MTYSTYGCNLSGDEPTASDSEATQEEYWDLSGEVAKARGEAQRLFDMTVYLCGDDEAAEYNELASPGDITEFVPVVHYSPFPFGENEEDPPPATGPLAESCFDNDEERQVHNHRILTLCQLIHYEKKMAVFEHEHAGEAFKVFRPEWIEAAIDDDVEPLFGDSSGDRFPRTGGEGVS